MTQHVTWVVVYRTYHTDKIGFSFDKSTTNIHVQFYSSLPSLIAQYLDMGKSFELLIPQWSKKIALGNWRFEVPNSNKSLQEQMFELLPWKFRTFANLRFQVWKYTLYWNAWPWFTKENYLLYENWACLLSVNNQLMFDISGNFTSPCKNYVFRNFKSLGGYFNGSNAYSYFWMGFKS